MNEREALAMLAAELPFAGDDAAVLPWGDGTHLVVTTDMLHDATDFPDGITPYTVGWRAVGASISDLAAMGADAVACVAAYAVPAFDDDHLRAFLRGARDVATTADAEYVGGDLDEHAEFTVTSTAVGKTSDPVRRSGATPGDAVCVTGELGRTAGALRLFERGETERANGLFRFPPRVASGRELAAHATAMMDSSDGLARSLHQLAAASDCGVAIERDAVPIHPVVQETERNDDAFQRATTVGEDFELVCTIPSDRLATARERTPVSLTRIGRVTDDGVTLDNDPLPDEGFQHGGT